MAGPKNRKAHVKRIYKTVTNLDTAEQEISTDVFIDVLRLDRLLVRFKSKEFDQGNQEIKYAFQWNDDRDNPVDKIDASKADKQFENANAKRKTKKLVIKDPDVKKADQDGDFYLWIVDKVKVFARMKETGSTNQLLQFVFNNNPKDGSKDPPAKSRRTTSLKIPNNDLGGMKMRKTAGDENADPQSRIVDWLTYLEALEIGIENKKKEEAAGTKKETDEEAGDEDTYFLNVEFTDRFIVRFKVDQDLLGFLNQKIHHVLQNKEIEELYVKGDDGAKDADGDTALLRTDPLQAIVNVGSNIIAVRFKPEDE